MVETELLILSFRKHAVYEQPTLLIHYMHAFVFLQIHFIVRFKHPVTGEIEVGGVITG